jgi:hypothetical protein
MAKATFVVIVIVVWMAINKQQQSANDQLYQ